MTFEVCEKFFQKWGKNYGDVFWFLLRVVAGAFFFNHGLSKMAIPAWTFMWGIGVLEILIGAALVLGIVARSASLLGAVIMIGAFIQVHALNNGWNPFTNGSELALLFLVIFLAISTHGPGKWSLGAKVFGKAKF